MIKFNFYCPECGDDSIHAETGMSWGVKEQRWEAGEAWGDYICNGCPAKSPVNEAGERLNDDGMPYVRPAPHDEDEEEDE